MPIEGGLPLDSKSHCRAMECTIEILVHHHLVRRALTKSAQRSGDVEA